jgi:probable F420-dependent oxidoreductase
MDLGRVGIWSTELRYGDPGEIRDAAAELEELGWPALWVPSVLDAGVLAASERLLEATTRVTVATGVLNLWMHEPGEVAAEVARLDAAHPGRFVLGIGVGAPVSAQAVGREFTRPLTVTGAYLDRLDSAGPPAPAGQRMLGAIGPKMLALAARRSAGAHPFLVPPGHTAQAREILGPRAVLAPHQAVIFETDPAAARAIAREALGPSLSMPHYQASFRRLGYSADDLAGGGSDHLIDAIIAWGDPGTISKRIREHHDAGADHVAVHVVSPGSGRPPRALWRRLSEALLG